jgi:hypothetical protein
VVVARGGPGRGAVPLGGARPLARGICEGRSKNTSYTTVSVGTTDVVGGDFAGQDLTRVMDK